MSVKQKTILVALLFLFLGNSALAMEEFRIGNQTSGEVNSFLTDRCVPVESAFMPSIAGRNTTASAFCYLHGAVDFLLKEVEELRAENEILRKELAEVKEATDSIKTIVMTFQSQLIEMQKIVINFAKIFLSYGN